MFVFEDVILVVEIKFILLAVSRQKGCVHWQESEGNIFARPFRSEEIVAWFPPCNH